MHGPPCRQKPERGHSCDLLLPGFCLEPKFSRCWNQHFNIASSAVTWDALGKGQAFLLLPLDVDTAPSIGKAYPAAH